MKIVIKDYTVFFSILILSLFVILANRVFPTILTVDSLIIKFLIVIVSFIGILGILQLIARLKTKLADEEYQYIYDNEIRATRCVKKKSL